MIRPSFRRRPESSFGPAAGADAAQVRAGRANYTLIVCQPPRCQARLTEQGMPIKLARFLGLLAQVERVAQLVRGQQLVGHAAVAIQLLAARRRGQVAARVVHARYPDSGRTWIRLRDGAYKGGNLFALFSPRAALATEFLRRIERFRKRPWRLVAALGPLTLTRFALGRLDLADALAAVSRVVGVRVDSVDMPFAECALDVDRPEDLALATRILAG